MAIHPTAIVDLSSEIDPTASVGPYAIIGPRVKIGAGTEIMGHVFIDKDTVIGSETRIFPFASIGADPQDMKYAGEQTSLVIGDRVTVRESATLHRGTNGGGGCTRIGNDCLIMATVHVAHDCQLEKGVILSSYAVLAGHVHVEEYATVSGSAAIHQFVSIGRYAFLGGMSGASKDVPPYMTMVGVRDKDVSITPNFVGLRRHEFTNETIEAIRGAYKIIHNHRPLPEVLSEADRAYPNVAEVSVLTAFYRNSERGVYR
jgi:UDP-N-acetylglucosamine acyltransferase